MSPMVLPLMSHASTNNRNDSISDDQIEVHVFRYQYTDTNVDVSTVIVRMSGRITGQVDCRVERFKMSGSQTCGLQYNHCKHEW